MNKKKVLIITDSLGLPRSEPERVEDNEVWPHMLANSLDHEVYIFSRGGLSSADIIQELSRNLGSYTPDILILQCGIVDCAPRALTRKELKIVSVLPILGKLINRLIKKYRRVIVTSRKISYTNKNDFGLNIEIIKEAFKNSEIYFVSILPAMNEYEDRNPGIIENIISYNKILENKGDVIFPYNDLDLSIITMSDFHHLNSNGQKTIFNAVFNKVFKKL